MAGFALLSFPGVKHKSEIPGWSRFHGGGGQAWENPGARVAAAALERKIPSQRALEWGGMGSEGFTFLFFPRTH